MRAAVAASVLIFALLRLCHVNFLWSDEDYHMAAAINILHRQMPYRDFWYDKPPLGALFYLLIGGYPGIALRLLGALYIVATTWLIYGLAKSLWSEREGYAAAFLLSFFLTFYFPSAVIPLAADGVMLLPHITAIFFVQRGRPFLAGVVSGIAFLANLKGVFVLAACAVWALPEIVAVIAGFAIPVGVFAVALLAGHAYTDFYQQVWQWGRAYSAEGSRGGGFIKTLHWLGFQALLLVGSIAAWFSSRSRLPKLIAWLALSFVAVTIGGRFNPRYFLQILPPLCVLAAAGIVEIWRRAPRFAVTLSTILLLVPLARFTPHYVQLADDAITGATPHWADLLLDIDSQHVAARLRELSKPGDTLMVWGYRPDIYVYTRLLPAGQFWDSQPLTGVDAGRALFASSTNYGGQAAKNRRQFIRSRPSFFVDSLSIFNPKLSPDHYPELRTWLAHYQLVGKTETSLIYQVIR